MPFSYFLLINVVAYELQWAFLVMSEDSRGLTVSPERNKVGPDYFGYYKCEVAELLSQYEDFLPFASKTSEISGGTSEKVAGEGTMGHSKKVTGSLFSNGIEDALSDLKRERLKALLRQSVNILAPEVKEVFWNFYSPFCFLFYSRIKSLLICGFSYLD